MEYRFIIQKVALSIFTFLFISINTFAQQNYLPGIIIKKDDVAIKGFIDYGNWAANPNEINFKQNLEEQPVTYNAIDIAEFRVDDEIYVSAIINSKILTGRLADIKVDQQLELRTDTTFLQTLIAGEKSLYYYKNDIGVRNFYIKNNNNFELLKYWKSYKKNEVGVKHLIEKNTYFGQLMLYLDDCSSTENKLQKLKYTLKSLKKIFENYYSCTKNKATFNKPIEKSSLEFGMYGGLTATSLKFTGASDLFNRFSEANFGPSIEPSFGVYFDYILPRNFRKWRFSNDLLFTFFKHTGKYQDFVSEENYRNYTTSLSTSYLKLNTQITYKYPLNDKTGIFLKAGLTNGLIIALTDDKTINKKFYTTEETKTEQNPLNYRIYELGFTASLGATYNKYRLEAKFERGDGIFRYIYANSISNRFYLLFGYSLFNKN